MIFDVLGSIQSIETIAEGSGIRELARLRKIYGTGNWKKKKGNGTVRLVESGEILNAELHWYEAHGRGKFEIKIKRFL